MRARWQHRAYAIIATGESALYADIMLQKGVVTERGSEGKETDMTSRDRVMASVNHRNPDCLPMDLGSNVSAGYQVLLMEN